MVLRRRRNNGHPVNNTNTNSRETGQHQQRKYMRDGRVVVEMQHSNNFSWLRCLVLLSIMTYLVVTNPANYEYFPHYYNKDNNSDNNDNNDSETNNPTINSSNSNPKQQQTPQKMRKTTNYGFFCVQEKLSIFRPGVTVHLAGYEWNCDYDHPDIGGFLCHDLLYVHMSHEKPLVYDPIDIVYTLYRITIWFLVLGHLYGFCHFAPLPSRRLLRHSLKSIFFDNDDLPCLPIKLYQLLIFLYPMLQNMEIAIQHQDSNNSIFAVFDSVRTNLVFSYVLLVVSAIVLNAMSKLWSGYWFLLKFDSLVAVILGYGLRYTQDTKHGELTNILFVEEFGDQYVSWTTVSWMSLFMILFFKRSLSTAIFWVLCHFAGQTLADYHIYHLVHANFGKSLIFGNTIQDAWLGIKYLVLSPLRR